MAGSTCLRLGKIPSRKHIEAIPIQRLNALINPIELRRFLEIVGFGMLAYGQFNRVGVRFCCSVQRTALSPWLLQRR